MKSPRYSSNRQRSGGNSSALFHFRRIAAIPAAILAAICIWAVPGLAGEPRDYTLALSWQATFCAPFDNSMAPGCRDFSHRAWAATHFALHGLWPNVDRNADGRINAEDNYCLAEAERRLAVESAWRQLPQPPLSADTEEALRRVMPGSAAKLDRHQWAKHGSCSGFDAERYFTAAIARTEDVAATAFSRFIAAEIGRDVARRDVIARFELDFGKGSGRALRLLCSRLDGTPVLMEIRLALKAVRIEEKLTRGSLAIPAAAPSGTCPTRFRIAAAR